MGGGAETDSVKADTRKLTMRGTLGRPAAAHQGCLTPCYAASPGDRIA